MKFNVPKHPEHDRVLFVVSPPGHEPFRMTCDDSLAEINIPLPKGVDDREVGVSAWFLTKGGQTIGDPMVIKEAKAVERHVKKPAERHREEESTEPEKPIDRPSPIKPNTGFKPKK